MRRRAFIALLAGATASVYTAPCSAQSQPSRVYRLGYLAPGRIPYVLEAFQDGLRKLGYVEGQNLKIEYRFLHGAGTSADALAAELVQLGPDLIVAVATPMVVAAKRATTTVPIVMGPVADPLHSGIVTSLAHPGGNITGTTLYGAELGGKRVDIFKQALPAIARLAVLGNATSPLIQLIWPETLTAAQSLKLDARLFTVRDAGELPATFEAMAQYGADAVVVLADALFNAVRKTIIQLAAKYRLPAMYEGREYAQDGGLISYGPNAPDMARRSAAFVDKILKGAKPGDLPIEQPSASS